MIDQAIYEALKSELERARERHEVAKQRFREATAKRPELARYTAGAPEADSSHILRNAVSDENKARRQHLEAMLRLNGYILNGVVPEHLNSKEE